MRNRRAALLSDALLAGSPLALQKARALGWSTGAMSERLDAYRHDRAWRGDLFASP
jgi:hypothetical protein